MRRSWPTRGCWKNLKNKMLTTLPLVVIVSRGCHNAVIDCTKAAFHVTRHRVRRTVRDISLVFLLGH